MITTATRLPTALTYPKVFLRDLTKKVDRINPSSLKLQATPPASGYASGFRLRLRLRATPPASTRQVDPTRRPDKTTRQDAAASQDFQDFFTFCQVERRKKRFYFSKIFAKIMPRISHTGTEIMRARVSPRKIPSCLKRVCFSRARLITSSRASSLIGLGMKS